MELRINLDNREDIAAAVSLLQIILGATAEDQAGTILPNPLYDASAVFGGAAPLVPPAPSIAAVAQPPIVPAAPSGISVPLPPASVPTAPNSAPAAVPAAPPAPPPASGVELDADGLPWDERIHAGTKTKIVKGTWKMKKGIDAAVVAAVTAQLRATAGNVPSVPAAGAAIPAVSSGTVASAPTPPAPGADPASFETLLPRITAGVHANVIPNTALMQACGANGIASIVGLQQQPAMVPLVWATLKQAYPALQ